MAGLTSHNYKVELMETRRRGDAEAFARIASDNKSDVAVAAGGDGTINEVMNGLCGSCVPLAIFPTGTANVLAAELQADFGPAALVEAIERGHTQEIWLAKAGGRYFAAMLGVGFDVAVISRVEREHRRRWAKSRWGRCAYLVAACKELNSPRFVCYSVDIDGQRYRASSLIIANGHYYGGRFITARQARLDEPDLYACIWGGSSRTQLLFAAIALVLGRFHSAPRLKILPAQRINIVANSSLPAEFHCDGDISGNLPIVITAGAAKLSVVMRQNS